MKSTAQTPGDSNREALHCKQVGGFRGLEKLSCHRNLSGCSFGNWRSRLAYRWSWPVLLTLSLCVCMCLLVLALLPCLRHEFSNFRILRARARHLITIYCILTHKKCESTGSYYFKLLPFGDFAMNLQKMKVMKWKCFRLDELSTVLPTESSPSSLDQILHCEGLTCLCNFSVFYLSSNKILCLETFSISISIP